MKPLDHGPCPSARLFDRFIDHVEARVADRVERVRTAIPSRSGMECLTSGGKLRTRLVARLAEAGVPGFDWNAATAACAATELVHSASLCHDDIIDEADVRRGCPTVWRSMGVPGAILVGDMLIIESFGVLAEHNASACGALAECLAWVIRSEADQEVRHRGQRGDAARWREVCEGKTGALFAFPARWACPRDRTLGEALHQAGLCLGVAYQMYDDLLDRIGDEATAGKTLGQDAQRGKYTIPAARGDERRVALAAIDGMIAEAIEAVERWPQARAAMETFVARDLWPRFTLLQDRAA